MAVPDEWLPRAFGPPTEPGLQADWHFSPILRSTTIANTTGAANGRPADLCACRWVGRTLRGDNGLARSMPDKDVLA